MGGQWSLVFETHVDTGLFGYGHYQGWIEYQFVGFGGIMYIQYSLYFVQKPDYCNSNFQYGCERSTGNGFIVNPITSARVRSENFSFKYGRVEIRAKLPKGDWLCKMQCAY